MKWLTLALIKEQLRLEADYTAEDNILTLYGNSAERLVLNYVQRTEDELKAMNEDDPTQVPQDIIHASLLLVDLSYQQRSTVSPTTLYQVPYSFDSLVMPYRKGTYATVE